jgi:flagellar operon protein (TIGR03826 family)
MSLQNVANCPQCGRVFVRGFRDVCPACYKKVEDQYDLCLKYLREHKNCTIYDLNEDTGVSVRQITKFIHEGRISIADLPNMTINCEVCGIPIRENNICDSCRGKLAKEYKNVQEDEARKQNNMQTEGKIQFKIEDRLKERR